MFFFKLYSRETNENQSKSELQWSKVNAQYTKKPQLPSILGYASSKFFWNIFFVLFIFICINICTIFCFFQFRQSFFKNLIQIKIKINFVSIYKFKL
jgi:hypothetical protein